MSPLCRVGLHRWDTETEIVARPPSNGNGSVHRVAVTRNRCQRAGCRYAHWMILDVAPFPPAPPAMIGRQDFNAPT